MVDLGVERVTFGEDGGGGGGSVVVVVVKGVVEYVDGDAAAVVLSTKFTWKNIESLVIRFSIIEKFRI